MKDDLDRLIRRVQGLAASARVGALDEENARKLSLQEFGSARGPDGTKGEHNVIRPSLSAATDRNQAAVFSAVQRGVQSVLDGKKGVDGEDILQHVGDDLAEEVQQEIDNNVPPPLAPSTLAARRRRGNASDRTLVDTDEMRQAIRCEAKSGDDVDDGWQ